MPLPMPPPDPGVTPEEAFDRREACHSAFGELDAIAGPARVFTPDEFQRLHAAFGEAVRWTWEVFLGYVRAVDGHSADPDLRAVAVCGAIVEALRQKMYLLLDWHLNARCVAPAAIAPRLLAAADQLREEVRSWEALLAGQIAKVPATFNATPATFPWQPFVAEVERLGAITFDNPDHAEDELVIDFVLGFTALEQRFGGMVQAFRTGRTAAQGAASPGDMQPAEWFFDKCGILPNTLRGMIRRGNLKPPEVEKRNGRWFYSVSAVRRLKPDALPDAT